jgi:hypothetical protein
MEANKTLKVDVPNLRAPIYIRESSMITWSRIVDNLGSGVSGRPYLVYGCGQGIDADLPGTVTVFDLKARETLWTYEFRECGLPASAWSDTSAGVYAVKKGLVDDFDGDGRAEIVVSGSYQPWASTFIWYFGNERHPVGVMYHAGHVERMATNDLDGDGKPELLSLGFHSASKGLSLSASRPPDYLPFYRPDASEPPEMPSGWSVDHQRCLWNLVIPVLPGLAAVEGRSTLGMAGQIMFTHSKDKSPRILIETNVSKPAKGEEDKPAVCDYTILADFSGHPTKIIPNAPMVDRARFWLANGKTDIDFVSDDVLNEWIGMMRTFDTVQLTWPPEDGQSE